VIYTVQLLRVRAGTINDMWDRRSIHRWSERYRPRFRRRRVIQRLQAFSGRPPALACLAVLPEHLLPPGPGVYHRCYRRDVPLAKRVTSLFPCVRVQQYCYLKAGVIYTQEMHPGSNKAVLAWL
jgi:hypothetical protein